MHPRRWYGRRASSIQQLLEEIRCQLLADLLPADEEASIAICTVDGRLYEVGQCRELFHLDSIGAPLLQGLLLQSVGGEALRTWAAQDGQDVAFPIAELVRLDPACAEDRLLEFFSDLAGRSLAVDERHLDQELEAMDQLAPPVIEPAAEPGPAWALQRRQSAIGISCRDLAVMAATLACQGSNPFTGKRVLDAGSTTQLLTLLAAFGMAEHAEDWLLNVGLPAVAGGGGGLLAVVPGRLGIGIHSPWLDGSGNSRFGLEACRELSQQLGLHLYNQPPCATSPIRARYSVQKRSFPSQRSPAEQERLERLGVLMRVIHVHGALDFPAMERLLAELDSLPTPTRVLVLDFNQVPELPDLSCRLLSTSIAALMERGCSTLLSCCGHLGGQTTISGLETFATLEQALERAENLLLQVG